MWTKSYTQVFHNVSKEEIWNAWADVNNWHQWDHDIDYAKLETSFTVGSKFILKPKGGPKVTIELVEVEPMKKFTDLTKFFGAKMYGSHEISEEKEGVRLTVTISVRGIFGFIWRKLVAENIIKTAPQQMQQLVEYARKNSEATKHELIKKENLPA